MPQSTDQSLPTLGRYRLATRLAIGGMAEIFLAYEQGAAGLERMVVVKRILPHLVDQPRFVDMFLREARIIARLSHPNVVHIHELGQVDGTWFIAMEYIHGSTLRELALIAEDQQLTIPLDVALSVLVPACRGAHAAHELRDLDGAPLELVHRDISPHNLMVTDHGDVKLLDFGVAKATADSREATYSGSVKGKFAYMSPEQCQGHPIDRRSDVFALGVVLWELCAGTTLFRRPTELEMLSAITETDAPRLRELRDDIPPAIDEAVARALARDRTRRFESAEAFRQALQEAADASSLKLGPDTITRFVGELVGEELDLRRRLLQIARERPLRTDERLQLIHRTGTTDATSDPGATRAERPSSISRQGTGSDAVPSPEPSSTPPRPTGPTLELLGAAGLLLLVVLIIALGSAPEPVAPIPVEGEPIVFGWAPTVDPNVLAREITPLEHYLERTLHRPVQMVVTRDYGELSDKLVSGEVQFAAVPPLLWVRTHQRAPTAELLALKQFDGSAGSDGYLLIRSDAPFTELSELEGKRFCFTDRDSTTGYFLPRIYLKRKGFDPDRFVGSVHWSGEHIQVLRDLLEGQCDVAATYSGGLQVADGLGVQVGRLRMLAITGYVPQDLIAAGPAATSEDKVRMTQALLDFDPQRDAHVASLGATQRITGFSPIKKQVSTALDELATHLEPP